MQRSRDRILTTHTGSLVRPREIVDIMRQVEAGQPYDAAALNRLLMPAVLRVARGRRVGAAEDHRAAPVVFALLLVQPEDS